jgi:hypothetical protein
MIQSNRILISSVVAILILSVCFLLDSQKYKRFDGARVDKATITNRQGQVLTLSADEARELASTLGEALDQKSVERVKTLFPNEISFYQAEIITLTIYAASHEMFTPGNMQVIKSGLARDKAYQVQDLFYQKLRLFAENHHFSLMTD